jgi:SAM-dependent methyltransferase
VDVERDRRYFDRWAPRYDRSLLQPILFAPTHVAVLDAAAEAGAHAGNVLDLGCGTGRLLQRAAKRWPGARFIGVDLSPRMIAEARNKHAGDERFRFEVGDAAALSRSLEPAYVDVAFSTISFHHWSDQLGGVLQVARVLRPGGLFVLADIRPPLLLRPIMRRFHGSRSRRRLFEDGGFTVVEQRRPLRLGGQVLITVGRVRGSGQA